MNNKVIRYLFILVISILFAPAFTVNADDMNGSNFGVKPIYPNTQDKDVGESGYFKLNLNPSQTEELKIEVKNFSNNNIVVQMSTDRATTSNTGLILYSTSDNKESKLKINDNEDFEKMIDKRSEEIQLEPLQKKVITIKVTTPKDPFRGEILGGIHFKEKKGNSSSKKMVTNTFSYSIPVSIKEKSEIVENELSLKEVKIALRNYHPFIEAVIENKAPSIIRDMSVDGEIYSLKKNEKWYEQKLQKLQMAPYSNFNFGFDLRDTEFIPGDYRAELVVTADGKKYNFKKNFSISAKDADKKNETAVHITKESKPILLYIILGLVLLLILLGSILFYSYKRKNMKKKKRKNVKKKKKNIKKKK